MQQNREQAPALPSALDFDTEWHRAAQEDGRSQRISRNVVRTIYEPPYGSGMTDTVRLGPDALVNVINCVVPRAAHWTYVDAEPLITLRASLACDVEFRYGASPAMIFNRPELTLTCMPSHLPLNAHNVAGARQQGIVAVFKAHSFVFLMLLALLQTMKQPLYLQLLLKVHMALNQVHRSTS
jgi:hypothetical protein